MPRSLAHRAGSADLSRRRFLQLTGLGVGAAAAAPLLAACGSGSNASNTAASGPGALGIQLSWVPDAEWSPIFLADANGYYRQQNVSVALTPGGSDIGAIEGIVAAGRADIGIATDITTVVAAAADGNPLVCIGAMYQSNLSALMSPPSAPLTSVGALAGKRIGGPQGFQPKLDAIFTLAGMKPDYKFVPTGYGPDALINGDCDALIGFLTDEVLAYERETKSKPALLTFTDAGLPAYTLAIFTTKETLKNKRETLKGFLRATRKGFADDQADPTAGPKLAVDRYGKGAGLELPNEIEHNRAYLPLAESALTKQNGFLWIDPAFVEGPIYRGMQASGLKTVPASQVLDTSLLQEIASEK